MRSAGTAESVWRFGDAIGPATRMRIAQVSPLAESVPPDLYGGTERIVAYLTDQLVTLGHDVTLFASGGSTTRGKLQAIGSEALRLAPANRDPMFLYARMIEEIAASASDFDVIHFHCDWVHLPLFTRLNVAFLTTLHGRLDVADLAGLTRRFGKAPFVSISQSQRRARPDLNWVATVHHGLPVDLLQPTFESGRYLAFLGRIAPEKGPHAAIRIAQASEVPLRIAAKVDGADEVFYRETVEPLLARGGAQLVGEIDDAAKSQFLGNALALIFPIDWPEPFGLVMIEAMACGTPVIAYRRGAVPEIIEEGVTGFILEAGDEGGAVAAIRKAADLDRRRIRTVFEQRFTARRMAEDYVRVYNQMASSAGAAACS
jgi:glycosyltransferase involved in cell wall biosynthesis